MLTIDYLQTTFLALPAADEQKICRQLEEVLQYAYEKHPQFVGKNWEMNLIFTDNSGIQAINKQYRGKDVPTDVISFAFTDVQEAFVFPDEIPQILGEIFLSVEKARIQAVEYEHSFERELIFLALHGFLHLLGYDHLNEADEHEMFTLQETILRTFGFNR